MNPEPSTKVQTSKASAFHWVKIISILLALLFALNAFFLVRVPDVLRGSAYSIFREIARGQMMLKTKGWGQLEDNLFVVRYQGDEKPARLVLDTARLYHQRICSDLDYLPKQKIPVVVYSSREELNASFGWPASENAMGVYWGGVIRVLAPEVWISDPDPEVVEQIFRQAGPMAHEMTHLVLDYVARGNYPRWFTEGLAQYQEYKMTGFVLNWQEADWDQGLYSLQGMDHNFDALPNQTLAYRQSLSAVEYIVAVYGEAGLNNIIGSLAQGFNFAQALERALGLDLETFEEAWRQWLAV